MADPQTPGVNWRELIKLAAPVIGEVASGGDRGAFLQGFQRAQQRAEQRQRLDAETAQRKKATAAQFLLDAGQHAQSMTDPVDFQNYINMVDHAGTMAGYLQPGEASHSIQFNKTKQAEAQLKELTAELDALEKGPNPFSLDDLAQSGAQIQLKSGKRIPVSTAMELTRQRPLDASGKAVAPPKRQDANASTDYGRFLAKWAKDKGKTVDTLTTQDELAAKEAFAGAGRVPVDPDIASMNKTLKELQIENARKPKGGPTDTQQFSMEERLAKVWNSATQSKREMTRQYGLMQTGLKRFRAGDKNGGSQAVLVTFQKILDPTSVVRESEYARTAAGQSALNRLEGAMDRLSVGGAGMTDGDLAAMVQTAGQFVKDMETYAAGQRRRIENQAKSKGLDQANIFDDVLSGETDPAASAQKKLGAR